MTEPVAPLNKIASASLKKRKDLLDIVFSHMDGKSEGSVAGGLLLAGDPGVGKTSFVYQMSQLLGIKLVVIETPHLIEEHIINIPFIVFDGKGSGPQSSEVKAKMGVKLANSALYEQISNAIKVSDSEYLAAMKRASGDIKELYRQLGGTDTEIPEEIKQQRDQFTCILFLDEFYRKTSSSIRNMLRGILNGRLGNHELPKNTFVLYASNMDDTGDSLDTVSLNQDFRKVKFEAPNKEEWFSYLVNKFKEDQHVKLNPDLIQKFFDLIGKDHLSHDDIESDVRTSPRRWEQLLLYINSSLPAKDEADARSLLTNVHANFRHYTTGDKSKLLNAVTVAVTQLIKSTSNITIGKDDIHSDEEWRDTLTHQIEQKMKLGEHRKYVPVISGLPGIGKTSHIAQIALKLGLLPIIIEVDKLSPEDITGLPLADEGEDGELNVQFSRPPLDHLIHKMIKAEEARLEERVKKFEPDNYKAVLEKFKNGKHKYLIFFDELNRVPAKTLNSLRRVILDKSFDDDLHLPYGSIVIAAINPEDTGVTELTKHMRDVLDILPAGSSWNKVHHYLATNEKLVALQAKMKNPEVGPGLLKILDAFYDRFSAKKKLNGADGLHFNIGASDIYISPREFQDLFASTIRLMDKKVSRFKAEVKDTEEATERMGEIREAVFDCFRHSLDFIITDKHQITSSENFFDSLREWFVSSPEADQLNLLNRKVKTNSFDSILRTVYDDESKHLFDDIEFSNYLEQGDPAQFKNDLLSFLRNEISTDKTMLHVANRKKKALDGDVVKIEKGMVSKFEHLVREILHAIKIHELSKEFLDPIKQVMADLIAELGENDDDEDDFMAGASINADITKYIKKLL